MYSANTTLRYRAKALGVARGITVPNCRLLSWSECSAPVADSAPSNAQKRGKNNAPCGVLGGGTSFDSSRDVRVARCLHPTKVTGERNTDTRADSTSVGQLGERRRVAAARRRAPLDPCAEVLCEAKRGAGGARTSSSVCALFNTQSLRAATCWMDWGSLRDSDLKVGRVPRPPSKVAGRFAGGVRAVGFGVRGAGEA